MDPARMIAESLTSDPGIREQNRHEAVDFRSAASSSAIRGHIDVAKSWPKKTNSLARHWLL